VQTPNENRSTDSELIVVLALSLSRTECKLNVHFGTVVSSANAMPGNALHGPRVSRSTVYRCLAGPFEILKRFFSGKFD